MRLLTPIALVAVALSAPGCGSGSNAGPGYGSPDGRKISELIDRLNDDRSTEGTLRKLFAAGVKLGPADVKKFPLFRYEVKGEPAVSGDTATAKIALLSELKQQDAGTQDWSFVKEGDAWKIKAAPLP